MAATEAQIAELASTIARQAQALADGVIGQGLRYAQIARIEANVATLKAWTPDDRGQAPTFQNESVEPISYYDAGRAAFAAGLPCIPLADGIVLAAVRILPVGAGAADIMRDWTNGWTDANLAVPVKDGE